MIAVDTLIAKKIRLPSPPTIAIRILDAVRRDDRSFSELAGVIKSDPALTARILKVANSPFYRVLSGVGSIEKALSVLGTNAIKNIALSFIIAGSLQGTTDGRFDLDHFWKRSVTAAVAADLIARLTDLDNDDLFVTALLQDIGTVIMASSCPDDYLRVLNERVVACLPLEEMERAVFGFDHQQAGAELLSMWKLPESVHTPIRYHHASDVASHEYRLVVTVLDISQRFAALFLGSRSMETELNAIKSGLASTFGIKGSAADTLIDNVAERTIEVFAAFDLEPGNIRPLSQMMQEANEELSNLNSSYELLVVELKQAKEKAEKLAQELGEANEKLMELAFRDGLTGLYNHRYFQEALDREMARADRYGRGLSLLLFDIDHFKRINDTYGHMRGDLVLNELGRVIADFVRVSDVAARYGGEEFAVVLPETDLAGAKTLAERLRSSVEQLVITADGEKITFTVSIGITSYHARSRVKEKARLIDMADKALYISKQSGRNRVSVMSLPGC